MQIAYPCSRGGKRAGAARGGKRPGWHPGAAAAVWRAVVPGSRGARRRRERSARTRPPSGNWRADEQAAEGWRGVSSPGTDGRPPAALLDVDGTLVDSNYHHAVAWYRAFSREGETVPLWQLHRHMGMGGDQLVAAVAGEEFDSRHGDAVRDAEKQAYQELIGEVKPLAGARRLVEELKRRGHVVVLASSAKAEETEHYLDLLDVRDTVDGWTTSADVEQTKPRPDLIEAAVARAGGGRAVIIGDSTWDFVAAGRAGVAGIGLMTGGFSPEELRVAGAEHVFESLDELIDGLDETPLKI